MALDIGALSVTCAVLGALTARAVVRLARRRATSQALAASALVLWLSLLSVAGFHEWRHHDTQAAASRVTQELTGDPRAHATCRRLSADLLDASRNLGFVSWNAARTSVLRYDTCSDLAAWRASSKSTPSLDQIIAVHVVAHEAAHVAGVRDEAAAECLAMSWDARAARLLGANDAQAEQLAARYLTKAYPRMGSDYQTDCSELDLAALPSDPPTG